MYDDIVLSILSDKSIIDEQQEETNVENLYIYDQRILLKCISLRVSKYTLNFYMENLIEAPLSYWILVLREIINRYSLNSLKLFLTDTEKTENLSEKIKELLVFIKSDLIEYLFENKFYLKKDMSKDDFINIITNSDLVIPYLFKWSMVYLDQESYKLCSKTILNESSDFDYSDEV